MRKVCIVGASGTLGKYMVQHALDRGYDVVGVCRERSVEKLDAFKGRITIIPGATNDREVIKRVVAGCDGVLVVLVQLPSGERPGNRRHPGHAAAGTIVGARILLQAAEGAHADLRGGLRVSSRSGVTPIGRLGWARAV